MACQCTNAPHFFNSTYMNNASSLSGSSLFSPHRNTDKQIIIKFVSLTILMGIALNLFLNVNGFNPAMILFKTDFPIPYLTFNSIPYAPSQPLFKQLEPPPLFRVRSHTKRHVASSGKLTKRAACFLNDRIYILFFCVYI